MYQNKNTALKNQVLRLDSEMFYYFDEI
jgi:hypothetical protein